MKHLIEKISSVIFGVVSLCCLSLVLLTPPPTWAQSCINKCRQDCGPIADVGKQVFAACMARCENNCNRPPTCKSGTGAIFPKYYVLGLVYAPPGCTSTSSEKCATQSSVDYKDGSSMGTKVSADSSFASGVSATVNTGFGIGGIATFGASVSGGYANTSTDSSSQTITKGKSLEIKVGGNQDGVDHDQDVFLLFLNPAVAIKESHTVVNDACGPVDVNWFVGWSTNATGEAIYEIPVAWLKNPSIMPANVAAQLKALNFTNTDYQTILAMDPFANGSTTIDSQRFAPTTYSFPYEPPLQQSDCNNGVCSCMSLSEGITNEFQTAVQSSSQTQYKLGFHESGGLDIGIFNLGASSDQNFTWTSTSTQADTTDSTQSATAAVSCPSIGYSGPTIMSIYWDTLFGSFLFVPTALQAQPQGFLVLQQGIMKNTAGQALRHQPVDLTFGGKTYHTFTNNNGEYVFFRPANRLTLEHPTTGELVIRGLAPQVVTLGGTQKTDIKVP
jgi:hypothetical protein